MTVAFEPHPKQLEFITAVLSRKHECLLYGGAAGGGKSFVSLATLILLARLYPNSKSHVIRESLPSLKRTTIPTFFKLCPKGFIRSFNQTDHIVTFANGSTLEFFPANFNMDKSLTRFDGLETNFFLLEECQELQKKIFDKCKLRVGRHVFADPSKQPPRLILMTCNPSQNWTKKEFHEPAMNGSLRPDYFYKRALMIDNPTLPAEYMAAMENLDELTKAVFVNGDWDVIDVDRPFAYSFNKFKTVKSGVQLNPNEPIILSFDFNVDPITCIAGQSFNDTIRIVREFRLRNSDVYQLCESIRVAFGDRLFIVTGDASGGNRSAMTKGAMNYFQIIRDELDLPKSAFKVPNVNPSIKNSRVLLNSMLEKHPDMVIDASCEFLIHDLQNVETTPTGDIDKGKDASLTHLLDCFRYYIWTFHNDFIRSFK
jgi:hypothetical protein